MEVVCSFEFWSYCIMLHHISEDSNLHENLKPHVRVVQFWLYENTPNKFTFQSCCGLVARRCFVQILAVEPAVAGEYCD